MNIIQEAKEHLEKLRMETSCSHEATMSIPTYEATKDLMFRLADRLRGVLEYIRESLSITMRNAGEGFIDSAGYKLLNQIVMESRPLLKSRIEQIINNLDEEELRESMKLEAAYLLDEKLFGKPAIR